MAEAEPLLSSEEPANKENCIFLLKAISAATVGAGCLVTAVNLYELTKPMPTRMYPVRCYTAVFGILIVLGEFEKPDFVIEYFAFLKSWIAKGLFVGFVGVLTLDTESNNDSMLQTAAALATIGFGAVYVVLGLLCLKTYRDGRLQHTSTVDEEKDEFVPPPLPAEQKKDEPSWLDPNKDVV